MGAPRFVLDRFWPSNLFLGGIPGAWYDPTDLSTMFQDSAGTTPVTAVEQPVGLILDKSQGLTQGSQLVVNGDGTTLTGWTPINDAGCTTTVSGGQFVLTTVAGAAARLRQTIPVTAGKTYAISVYVNAVSVGSNSFDVWGTGYGAGALTSTTATYNGTFTAIVQATTANLYIQLSAFSGAAGITNYYDNVSVRELAGNHASQSTAASRPTYRARYNLLTYSEQFENAPWFSGSVPATSVTPNVAVAPDGTTTADKVSAAVAINWYQAVTTVNLATHTFSCYLKQSGGATTCEIYIFNLGSVVFVARASFNFSTGVATNITGTGATMTAVGNGWFRCTVTGAGGTNTSIGLYNTTEVLAWGAQLLTAADVTATGNAYQRIAAATVYDTAPIFRPYLAFDGVDDSLSTAAINFTSTDKMTVFAGASKLSDTGVGIVSELSADTNTNTGAWFLAAPVATFANGNYGWVSKGTTSAVVNGAIVLAPNTSVLTGIGDISGDVSTLRRSGAVYGTNAADQGAGNYGNHAMFIGRRGGASLPFNGRLYSLIVRGAASSTTEIIDTETWVNARTGAY